MASSFTRRARVAYYLAWAPMTALLAVLLGMRGMSWWSAAIAGVALALPFAVVCGASYYMARAMPVRGRHALQVLGSLIGASLAASGVWVAAGTLFARVIGGAEAQLLVDQAGLLFGVGVAFFVLSLAFHYLVIALEDIRRAERRTDEARVLTREAELRALRAQIDPHFLFNSLNSIAALTAVDPHRAREMCQLLSEFFRSTLRLGDRPRLTLGDELGLARRYLDIERVRFADRMTVDERIDESCLALPLPPLLLQPLVENAVKHGVSGLEQGSAVELRVARDGARIVIGVENRFAVEAAPRGGAGRGLAIVGQRLRSFYGEAARMVVRRNGDRFRVELRLPEGLPAEDRVG